MAVFILRFFFSLIVVISQGLLVADGISLEAIANSGGAWEGTQVEWPSGMRVGLLVPQGIKPPALGAILEGRGNCLEVFEEGEPYDVALVPWGTRVGPEASLVIYYDHGVRWGNCSLPLTEERLARKVQAMEFFHLSQVRRTDFAGIIQAMGEELGRAEAYWLPSGQDLTFQSWDRVVIAAPHPDDAEIGTGALIQDLAEKGVPVTVWNMTTGHRAAIFRADVLDGVHFSPSLKEAIARYVGDWLLEPKLKSQLREEESDHALRFLNPDVQVEALRLPFYLHAHYAFGRREEEVLKGRLESLKGSRLLVLAPFADDDHPAHRATTELVAHVLGGFPEVDLGYYMTPWTGRWNLYLYGKEGSRLAALVGTERLAGKGQSALSLADLGGERAERYWVVKP